MGGSSAVGGIGAAGWVFCSVDVDKAGGVSFNFASVALFHTAVAKKHAKTSRTISLIRLCMFVTAVISLTPSRLEY